MSRHCSRQRSHEAPGRSPACAHTFDADNTDIISVRATTQRFLDTSQTTSSFIPSHTHNLHVLFPPSSFWKGPTLANPVLAIFIWPIQSWLVHI